MTDNGHRQVIILSSPPAGGKTTYAKRLEAEYSDKGYSVLIVSADHEFAEDYSDFAVELLGAAHIKTHAKYLCYLEGHSEMRATEPANWLIIVDNTNTSAAELAPYYQAAQAYEWDVVIHRITCPFDVCYSRNDRRKGLRRVPGDVLATLWVRFATGRYLMPWWKVEEINLDSNDCDEGEGRPLRDRMIEWLEILTEPGRCFYDQELAALFLRELREGGF